MMPKENSTTPDEPPVLKRPRKFFVQIDRKPDVQSKRLELPVCMHEQEIIEAIHNNDVVLITGATGTGKTTQVPQFLVEDGFGHPSSPMSKGIIAITQPRRVAAVSCAKRVSFEMNSSVGNLVGYQIRHDSKVGPNTRVKFGTDGIFLREVEHDILLKKYSAVVIDEVHERSLNTDLLLSFLSRSVIMRRQKLDTLGPLKVIIMSATLDIEGVFSGDSALFPNPPVIKVPSRQYPITIHFAKRTVDDYVDEAYRNVAKIHRRLPQGGILVFLSGREEVERLCSKLHADFGDLKVKIKDSDVEVRMGVLPFYSLLPDHLQRRVFDNQNDDIRKVIVATNIAETSVTVPGISYVVDSGRAKEKVYKGTGCARLSAFEIGWISQASAEQRAGRAGRTGPGHCYRLYSSAVYVQQFAKFREPEVLRVPADAIVLRLRAMGIRHVHQFPFPSAPHESDIITAEKLLSDLGALRNDGYDSVLGVTKVGRELALLPVEPRLGRMLICAKQNAHILPYACRLGGVLSVGTMLQHGDDASLRQGPLRNARSDLLTELSAMCAVEHSGKGTGDKKVMRALCERLAVHAKCLFEAIAISEQIGRAIGASEIVKAVPKPPNASAIDDLLRAVVAGFGDRIARRMSRDEAAAAGVIPRLMRRAFVTPFMGAKPVFLEGGSPVRVIGGSDFVCFTELVEVEVRKRRVVEEDEEHDDYEESEYEDDQDGPMDEAAEENARQKEKEKEKEKERKEMETRKAKQVTKRLVMRGASVVEAKWIMHEAGGMCHWSLIRDKDPEYDSDMESVTERVAVSYGPSRWRLGWRRVTVEEAGKIAEGRRDLHCAAFAKGLVEGRVREGLRIDRNEGKFEVCLRRVEQVLNGRGIYSVALLRSSLSQCKSELVRAVELCCSVKHQEAIRLRWDAELSGICRGDSSDDDDDDDNQEVMGDGSISSDGD